MNDILGSISTRSTPQTQRSRPEQVKNNAGGFTFAIDPVAQLRRFLILGVDGGTYYASAKTLAVENADIVITLAKTQPLVVLDVLTELDEGHRVPKHNTILFALAAVAGLAPDPESRRAALDLVPTLVRTGTHLFTFVGYAEQFRGWGRSLRRAVASWYETKGPEALGYQMAKYRQREGWSHRDVLRLAHPSAPTAQHRALYDWATKPSPADEPPVPLPENVALFIRAQNTEPDGSLRASAAVAAAIAAGLSWEMLPEWALRDVDVWKALVTKGMPTTALLRQLPRLTRLGVLADPQVRSIVIRQLTNARDLAKSRIHPVQMLIAQRTYASGASVRGDSTWVPDRRIVDALDEGFYKAFASVEPTGKRTMLALDVSGSMTAQISGLPLTAREASAALALVTLATEPNADAYAFTSATGGWYRRDETLMEPLTISPRQRLDDALRVIDGLDFGFTDCSLPMLHALKYRVPVDMFVIYTDNETYAGTTHPHEALERYRREMGIDARLVVVAMTSTGFSIADPKDSGMLDVVGFDAALPELLANFSEGL